MEPPALQATTENTMQKQPDPTSSPNTQTRIRGRWAPGVSGNPHGRPPAPEWQRLNAIRRAYEVLDDRNNRLPDLERRLIAALEARLRQKRDPAAADLLAAILYKEIA